MMRKLLLTLLCLFTAHSSASLAADSNQSIFSFDAFGTLGAVYSDEDKADFSGTNLYQFGVGHSKKISANIDSLIGGQVSADFNDKLTGVVQIISKRSLTGDYTPEVEWANLRYQLTPELSIRLGRAVLSSFMASTYRNIGYANHWVRPPIEVYGLVPLSSRDGISANYTFVQGNIFNNLEITYGEIERELLDGYSFRAKEGMGINNTLEIGNFLLHGSFQYATLELDIYDPILQGFRLFGDSGAIIADRYDPNDSKLAFTALGVTYDAGTWFAMAEWGQTRSDAILGNRDGAYLSTGRRIGRLTPFITFAKATSDRFSEALFLDLSTLPETHKTLASGLNQSLRDIQSLAPIQDSISVGLRWEVDRRISIVAQYDHTDIHKNSFGTLTNPQPGFQAGGSLNLISASLSFVFP